MIRVSIDYLATFFHKITPALTITTTFITQIITQEYPEWHIIQIASEQ